MTPNEYQQKALRTEVTPPFVAAQASIPGVDLARLLHGLIGICTEAGEAQDAVKKYLVYGKSFDATNMLEEIGDVMWYCALALDACGFTMELAMQRNIEKLLKRFPDKFTEDAAINRDVAAERAVLEGGALPTTEEIANLNHRLQSILEDPHPGLSTWVTARNKVSKELYAALGKVLGTP